MEVLFIFCYSTYGTMVALFFVVQVTNNYAFTYDVPMTLHMIFRSVSTHCLLLFTLNTHPFLSTLIGFSRHSSVYISTLLFF